MIYKQRGWKKDRDSIFVKVRIQLPKQLQASYGVFLRLCIILAFNPQPSVVMCLTNQTGGDKNTKGGDFRNKSLPFVVGHRKHGLIGIVCHSKIEL
jgi:hypothetical protein